MAAGLGAGVGQNPNGAVNSLAPGSIVFHGTTTPVPRFASEFDLVPDTTGAFITDVLGRIPGWFDDSLIGMKADIHIPPADPVTVVLGGLPGPPGISADWQGIWDSTKTYKKGDAVARLGVYYLSNVDGNLNHDPSTDNVNWTSMASVLSSVLSPETNVKAFGALGNGQEAVGSTVSGHLDQLQLKVGQFPSNAVGMTVYVLGAGSVAAGLDAAGSARSLLGVPHRTTISSVVSGVAHLATACAQAVTNVRIIWGNDDSNAVAMADAVARLAGNKLMFPSGNYLCRSTKSSVRGGGTYTTLLWRMPDLTVSTTLSGKGDDGAGHYALGNYLPIIGNPQGVQPTGIIDDSWQAESITIDGMVDPGNPNSFNGLQGNGIDIYAIDHATLFNVRIQNCPYAAAEVASNRSGSELNDGTGNTGIGQEVQGNAGNGARLKEPMPVFDFDAVGKLEVENIGMQWGTYGAADDNYQLNGGIAAGVDHAVVSNGSGGDPTSGIQWWFPGKKIALGAAGVDNGETPVSNSYEVVTVDKVDLNTKTVWFTAPTQFAHATATPCSGVNYWGDPGFGVILREPTKDASIDLFIADRIAWGGLSGGQVQNYKYNPFNIGRVAIRHVRIKRAGMQGAPFMKWGAFRDVVIGGGTIGDEGGQLAFDAPAAATVLRMRLSESREKFIGEPICIGFPGTVAPYPHAMEQKTIVDVIESHQELGGAKTTNTSVNVNRPPGVTWGTWTVGERILGNTIPLGAYVAALVSDDGLTTDSTMGHKMTNPSQIQLSVAAKGTVSGAPYMPIFGGDTIVIDSGLATSHLRGEPIFCNPMQSPGLGIQQVGFADGTSFKVSNLEIIHCYDDVQITNRDGIKTPSAPTLALVASAGNLGSGKYRYYITNISSTSESEPSQEVSITTDGTHQKVTLTNILPGPGGTLGRRIYRSVVGGPVDTGQLVAQIEDNTTTTYTDNIADSALGPLIPAGVVNSVFEQTPPLAGPINRRVSFVNVNCRGAIRHGWNNQDGEDVMRTNCTAIGCGGSGFANSNTNGQLRNDYYTNCISLGNGRNNVNNDWDLVGGSYVARACKGLADAG